jgi:hypothetical protein
MDAAAPLLTTMTARQDRIAGRAPHAARVVLALVVLGAVLASVAVAATYPHAARAADPALTLLLRAMAVIKAGMAAGVIAAIFWRLGVAATPVAVAAYAAVSAAMASGPILIWGMTNLVFGAILLHAGLVLGVVMLWRDPATTTRLKAVVAARRLNRE